MSALNLGLLVTALAVFNDAAPTADISLPETAMVKRAGPCAFNGRIDLSKLAAALPTCTSVTFDSVIVPAGKTLDLSKLADKTTVNFQGTSSWDVQKGFAGPLLSIGGKDIVVTGGTNAKLDGQGAQYWDGLGSNTNVAKPKFFAAHNLVGTSSINNLYLLNTPVQAVSINGCNGLTVNHMTIDNSAGNGLPTSKAPHNTDGFDIGASSNILIDHAVVHNQDDCVAVNSGTVSGPRPEDISVADHSTRVSPSRMESVPVGMVFQLDQSVMEALSLATLSATSNFWTVLSLARRMVSASNPSMMVREPSTR
jgi:hypothetical protein